MKSLLTYQFPSAGLAPASGREEVLRILLYFDIFHYPLTAAEIRQYLAEPTAEADLDSWIQHLTDQQEVFLHNGFYSVQNNPLLALRRKQGNERAEKLLVKGLRIGRFLYQFPFVKAIGISGSLSKNYADEKADIDFFVITSSNRLWLARTIMHLYKKLTFITGRQHYFCMNYYVDEKALELDEKNIFTAIEIKTLLPVQGQATLQSFNNLNEWADSWLPGFAPRIQVTADRHDNWFKRFVQWLWNGKTGNRLDDFLMRTTQRRWDKKQKLGKRNVKGLPMDLDTGKHFARSNPGAFREKVLQAYHDKLKQYHLA